MGEVTDDSIGLVDASAAPYASRLTLGAGSPSGSASSGSGSSSGGPGAGPPPGGYDPVAALSAFKAAGYLPGSDGALQADVTGVPVTLSLLVPSGYVAVGIRVTLHPVSLSVMLATTLPKGDYQMALAPFQLTTFAAAQTPVYSDSVLPASLPPPTYHRSVVLSGDNKVLSGPGTGGGTDIAGAEAGAAAAGVVTRDVTGLDDPVVETDLSDALSNLNPTDDATFLNKADAELWLDVPTIPLFEEPIEVVHSSSVRGVTESPTWAGVFWDAQSWAIQSSPAVAPTSVPSVSGQPGGS